MPKHRKKSENLQGTNQKKAAYKRGWQQFPSRLPDLAAERVENPLLVGAPERRDKQPLGAISSEPVDDRLRRQQLQAVDNQITIRIQCK